MNDAAIYVKVNAEDKRVAELVLKSLGLNMSMAIQMLLKQIIYKRSLPFDVSLPEKPIAIGNMSEEEIALLYQEGIDSLKEGSYSTDDMRKFMKNT